MTGILIVIALVGVAAYFAVVALRAWVKYRGTRVVTCPETEAPAAVKVDVGHAAVSAAWDHTEIRLEQCSRWPERKDCAQPCVKEIAAAPHDCLMRSILSRWYEGKRCVYCDKPLSLLALAQQPALRHPDGHTFDFAALPPEQLIAELKTFSPVCFDCHLAEQFRRQYPAQVTERPDYPNRV